jgi:hypothetical protein
MGLMLQMAQAQSMPNNQTQVTQSPSAQVLQIDMPQRSFGDRLLENTTLNYYTQFLGPSLGGNGGETYNVFIEGRSAYQSFHAASLRYQFNSDWAMGASLAATNSYGDSTSNIQTSNDKVRDEFYNARLFVNTPSLMTRAGTLFTTVSYEAPTSIVSRKNDMRFGYVLAQNFALKLDSFKLSTGVSWQYYRMVYNENVKSYPKNHLFPGSLPYSEARQTTIVSGGPYLNYRFNDKWGMTSSLIFDWDQRGKQTNTQSYNNNLPDRARLGFSYYPTKFKQISNVGLFTQSLLKYTRDTQVVGAELAAKF